MKDLKGTMTLTTASTVAKDPDAKGEVGFTVKAMDKKRPTIRTFELRADSGDEAKHWMRVLKAYVSVLRKTAEKVAASSAAGAGATPGSGAGAGAGAGAKSVQPPAPPKK